MTKRTTENLLESSNNNVVLSVKPHYAKLIVSGEKTVELRRRFPDLGPGTLIYVYSSSPEKALVGLTKVHLVERLKLSSLWKSVRDKACVDKKIFSSYFDGCSEGVAVHMRQIEAYSKPISLEELRRKYGFVAPQSFSYARSFKLGYEAFFSRCGFKNTM